MSSTSSKTGVAHEYGYGQPVAPTHDRGHECTQAVRGDAEGPYSQLQAVRCVSQAVPGHGHGGGYLSRYTHRVAISNRRLIAADHTGVTFRWKNYRIEGPGRYQTMTLSTHEFIRRFLIHVLPGGFHRIRHYGLLASGSRAANIARARELLAVPVRSEQQDASEAPAADQPRMLPRPCPCCGGRMFIIETFARGSEPKHRPTHAPTEIRIDTS
ncbi:hypothetical protein V1281_006811 [Nitrobacteraceae bacterium AZCC 2161]